VGDASWEWHVQNDHIVWSPELYRIYGLEPREFRPSYDAYMQRIHPADRKRVQMIVAQAMRDRKPYDFEHRVIWPDGTERVVSAHGEVEDVWRNPGHHSTANPYLTCDGPSGD
jgi:PAS domain-containing protein